MECSIENCSGGLFCGGWCGVRYQRWYKHGDPLTIKCRIRTDLTRTPTYVSYWHMLARCNDAKRKDYKYYGGRGITVCDRWLGREGFVHFLEDMGQRPISMTLDRENTNGNYEPSNCRWADNITQHNNQRLRKDATIYPLLINSLFSNLSML